jgi:hypothetical protein
VVEGIGSVVRGCVKEARDCECVGGNRKCGAVM